MKTNLVNRFLSTILPCNFVYALKHDKIAHLAPRGAGIDILINKDS